MLLQRYASNACARKMLALSRPKIAVTVSIIIVVHMPRRHRTVWGLHSQNDFGEPAELEVRLMIPGNSCCRPCHILPVNEAALGREPLREAQKQSLEDG